MVLLFQKVNGVKEGDDFQFHYEDYRPMMMLAMLIQVIDVRVVELMLWMNFENVVCFLVILDAHSL